MIKIKKEHLEFMIDRIRDDYLLSQRVAERIVNGRVYYASRGDMIKLDGYELWCKLGNSDEWKVIRDFRDFLDVE